MKISKLIPITNYTFLISQSSESNPVLQVLENSTGAEITWVRESLGRCVGTADNEIFLQPCFIPQHRTLFRSGTSSEICTLFVVADSGTTVSIEVRDSENNLVDDALNDTPVEINLYPIV